MATHSDLTFIRNENGQSLPERFKVLIKDTEFFDVLVGYFYVSLVDSILKAKSTDPKADTTEQEAAIDRLLCGLYGLTAAELATVGDNS